MDEVRANKADPRVPVRPSSPAREGFGWLVIIAITVGLDLVALQDAEHTERTGWVVFFCVLIAAKLVTYSMIAWRWSRLFE